MKNNNLDLNFKFSILQIIILKGNISDFVINLPCNLDESFDSII